ncbi:C40 family peptidase [Cohnella cholangitidis]|uniref:NlpC/P60 family protein n=1 Tax=Cohnella cholangitidis TaxID=2598458 RepID=A0A7G5C008_9BACL|nr:C40 family peptidase [Cohnella cholangitidis]QMV42542.1 NlpC/P60 family protein [Cohnella cholangitidis]
MRKVSVFLFSLALLLALQVGSAFADSKLDKSVDDLIGIRYDYGGTTKSGFDCSGFTGYVFNELGIDLPRTSRDMFSWEKATKIATEDLRPGDLVFFNTSGNGVSHVGIYVGNNNFAHAASKGVTITSLDESYYAKRYLGARRVMSDETYKKVATEPEAVEVAAAVKPQ